MLDRAVTETMSGMCNKRKTYKKVIKVFMQYELIYVH